nr:hypothetical protein [Tanacetum cinerariifolium]
MWNLKDLTHEERIMKEYDIRATNITLHGLPNDIYTLLNHKTKAHDICYWVKELIERTKLTKQERESKFVTRVKRARNIHEVSFDLLYAYLKQNKPDANKVRAMKSRFPDPLAFIANTFNPPPSYSSYKSQYNPQVTVVAQHQPNIPQPTYEPLAVYQLPPVLGYHFITSNT